MSKTISKFRFKQFSVSHHISSMKVGVDAVVLGAWVEVDGAHRILDVGTGCGLIALMMAQRAHEARIDAIDIDLPSVEEATENVGCSPWAERIKVHFLAYSASSILLKGEDSRYDLIVSNPPYFDAGVSETHTAREKARHQGELSPASLLSGGLSLLDSHGSLAMIVPTDIVSELEEKASAMGYILKRKCMVRGHEEAPYKRVLLQWRLRDECSCDFGIVSESLTLEHFPGNPTDEYRHLCKDFYLKF